MRLCTIVPVPNTCPRCHIIFDQGEYAEQPSGRCLQCEREVTALGGHIEIGVNIECNQQFAFNGVVA